jgi:hypothetical protein
MGRRSSNNLALPPAPGHEMHMQLPPNTVIIPLTDAEKERYLERAAAMQGRGSSGATTHADSTGEFVMTGPGYQGSEGVLSGEYIPPHVQHLEIRRTREERLEEEFGTPRSPAEM